MASSSGCVRILGDVALQTDAGAYAGRIHCRSKAVITNTFGPGSQDMIRFENERGRVDELDSPSSRRVPFLAFSLRLTF